MGRQTPTHSCGRFSLTKAVGTGDCLHRHHNRFDQSFLNLGARLLVGLEQSNLHGVGCLCQRFFHSKYFRINGIVIHQVVALFDTQDHFFCKLIFNIDRLKHALRLNRCQLCILLGNFHVRFFHGGGGSVNKAFKERPFLIHGL